MKESLKRLTSKGEKAPFLDEFPPACEQCLKRGEAIIEKCPIDGKKARHTRLIGSYGEMFECTKKHSLIVSLKQHSALMQDGLENLKILAGYKRLILEQYEKAFNRLLHNVERNDAHIIQEFQNVVPESALVGAQGKHREIVADMAKADIFATAKALTQVFKAAISIKNELTIYQRLYIEPVWRDTRDIYSLHRVFMSTAYKFYDEFNEQVIWLNVGECYDYVEVDFECVSVVLFHLLDNSRKYALPKSEIDVSFERSSDMKEAAIRIEMTSLAADEDEREKIFLEGISGKYAHQLERAGKGMGLSIVRDVVTRAGLSLAIQWAVDGGKIMQNKCPYTRNVFTLGKLRLARVHNTPKK